MSSRRLGLALGILSLAGCTNSTPPSGPPPVMQTTTPVSQDIDRLGKLISLPERPLSAQWTITTLGDGQFGPQDESLTAVLRYPPGGASRLIEACPSLSGEASFPSADWFPEELKKALSGAPGDLDRREPTPFARSPFLHGWVVRAPDSDTLLVCLFTT